MKIKIVLLVLFSLTATNAAAWTYGEKVKISAVTLWEGSNTNPLYFKMSNNVWCYVPANEKSLYSLILTLYASGKVADIHCYDQAESAMEGMAPAHKLHRVVAM